MDPDETLRQLRTKLAQLRVLADTSTSEENAELACAASELVDLVDGLDQWLTRGGFPPGPWRQ